MEYRLKLIDLHTLETWSLRLHVESKITPRFLGGSSLGLISWLSGEPDYFGRNKISSGGDLSHYSSASLY